MRLIDADALLKHKDDHEMISTHLIWNAPTVEPKQGRWIDCKDPTTIGYECSECGKYCAEVEFIPECDFMSPVWNYCPNCGCRNRKENE